MKILTETPRLILREWNTEDASFIYTMNEDPEVTRWTGDGSFGSIEKASHFIEAYDQYRRFGYGRWLVILKESERSIGWCGVKNQMEDLGIIDLGFRFLRSEWGKGFATEAALASIQLGFEKFLIQKITGRAAIANKASIAVLRKIGMEFSHIDECEHHPAEYYCLEKERFSDLKKGGFYDNLMRNFE